MKIARLARYTAPVAQRLNLAALTAEELSRLLGEGRAQRLLPDIATARMAGRPYPGPLVPVGAPFEPVEARAWGATLDHARALTDMAATLRELGFTDLGALRAPGELNAPYRLAFVNGQDSAAMLSWDEAPGGPEPFAQFLSLLRDRASGLAAVLTSSAAQAPAPAPSEETDLQVLPGAPLSEVWAAHQARLIRQGRGQKMATLADFERAWETQLALDLTAWARRGLMMEAT